MCFSIKLFKKKNKRKVYPLRVRFDEETIRKDNNKLSSKYRKISRRRSTIPKRKKTIYNMEEYLKEKKINESTSSP